MSSFFAYLYEWFGIMPFYSKDLDIFLRGWDFACTGYLAIPWYVFTGWLMIAITTIIYALQYDIVDTSRFNTRKHWLLVAFVIFAFNFITASAIPFIAIKTGRYCPELKISVSDCLGFGISNAVWGLILFAILSTAQPLTKLIKNNTKG